MLWARDSSISVSARSTRLASTEATNHTCQVIVNGVPAGTCWARVGRPMGLPLGMSPTGFCLHAETRLIRAAEVKIALEKRIVEYLQKDYCSRSVYNVMGLVVSKGATAT